MKQISKGEYSINDDIKRNSKKKKYLNYKCKEYL